MPVNIPFTSRVENHLDLEKLRWSSDFGIRPGEFNQRDREDVYGLAKKLGKDPLEDDLTDLIEEFDNLKGNNPPMHRLPVFHISQENLTAIERYGDLPEGIINDITQVAADYIDGFMPAQGILPVNRSEFRYDTEKSENASYSLLEDKSVHFPVFGTPEDGTPALAISSHETIHKNNISAITDFEETRNYAWIYQKETPEAYTNKVERTSTAEVHHDLLGGLALKRLDEEENDVINKSYSENRRESIDFSEWEEEFEEYVDQVKTEYDLSDFDIRDETISKSVTFFLEGFFHQNFESNLSDVERAYNSNEIYSQDAGTRIAENLRNIKAHYESLEGTMGERFRETMQNRIPYLKGEADF